MSANPLIREAELCHALAEQHKPDVPVANSTIWVAVVLHDKTLDVIERTEDFLWMKCHRRITARTLKHMYFSRYPLADFRLEHQHQELEESEQLKDIYEKNHVKDGTVILRAINLDDCDLITYLRRSPSSPPQRTKRADGKCLSDALVIDSDDSDDEDTNDIVAKITEASLSASATVIPPSKKRSYESADEDGNEGVEEVAPSPQKKIKLVCSVQSSDQAYSANYMNGVGAELAFSPSPQTEIAQQNFEITPPHVHFDAGDACQQISEAASSVIATNQFLCVCGKDAPWRDWTQFDANIRPLCTVCSRAKLLDVGDVTGLRNLEKFTCHASNQEAALQIAGIPQNLEYDDAPANLSEPVAETSMHSRSQFSQASASIHAIETGIGAAALDATTAAASQVLGDVSLSDCQESNGLRVAEPPATDSNEESNFQDSSYYKNPGAFLRSDLTLTELLTESNNEYFSTVTNEPLAEISAPSHVDLIAAGALTELGRSTDAEEVEEMRKWFKEHDHLYPSNNYAAGSVSMRHGYSHAEYTSSGFINGSTAVDDEREHGSIASAGTVGGDGNGDDDESDDDDAGDAADAEPANDDKNDGDFEPDDQSGESGTDDEDATDESRD